MKINIALFLISLLVAMNSAASPYDDALTAYNNGDYSKAFTLFNALAENGNSDAQFKLAIMHGNAQGVCKDDKKLMYWLKRAADNGQPKAEYHLGFFYRYGFGFSKDIEQSKKWFSRSANHGNNDSALALANIYLEEETTENNNLAIKWLEVAAKNNHTDSMHNLGVIYLKGDIVEQNLNESEKLLLNSAKNGNVDSQNLLGYLYGSGSNFSKNYKQSFYWYKQAAMQGSRDAQYFIGILYDKGIGVKTNYIEAYAWLKCAEKNWKVEDFSKKYIDESFTISHVKNEEITFKERIQNLKEKLSKTELNQAIKLADSYYDKYPYMTFIPAK